MIYTQAATQTIHQQHFAYLKVEEQTHCLHLTLNRPAQKNALNEVLIRELAYALSYAQHHNHIWVITLGAVGDVFCAGADLKMLRGHKDEHSGSSIPLEPSNIILADLFEQLDKPCIAKVNQPVYAGGFLLLTGCSQVVAASSSTFTLSEVKRGLWPFQVMASLLKVMPERKVLDWCMLGGSWTAENAYHAGLVSYLVQDGDVEPTVDVLVKQICQNSPTAIRLGLKAARAIKTIAPNQQQQFLYNCLMELVQTADAQEGLKAFKEKRQPQWLGE